MKVSINVGYEGTFVEGTLKGVMSEQGAHYPDLVVELTVAGRSDPAMVYLDVVDLSTIVRLAKNSGVQEIRDAVR
jgi:hypothetical protein